MRTVSFIIKATTPDNAPPWTESSRREGFPPPALEEFYRTPAYMPRITQVGVKSPVFPSRWKLP